MNRQRVALQSDKTGECTHQLITACSAATRRSFACLAFKRGAGAGAALTLSECGKESSPFFSEDASIVVAVEPSAAIICRASSTCSRAKVETAANPSAEDVVPGCAALLDSDTNESISDEVGPVLALLRRRVLTCFVFKGVKYANLALSVRVGVLACSPVFVRLFDDLITKD